MSAFIVSKKHIDYLVVYAFDNHIKFYVNGVDVLRADTDYNKIGQILVDQNYNSVNFRYNKNETPYCYKTKFVNLLDVSPIQIIKLCHCLEYQSCETEDYYTTIAHSIINSIIHSATCDIDGYEKAEWAID